MPPAKLAPVISVINMKGGVGKTTISGNVFRELYRRQRKNVLLIDFDPQYNLSQLILTRDEHEQLLDETRTLWHIMVPDEPTSIFDVSDDDLARPKALSSYTHRLKQLPKDEAHIDLIAGDFRMVRLTIQSDFSAIRINRLRFEALMLEARSEYDLVVLDCNPSSSFMTYAAVESSTHLLVPVRPDKYSILGLEMLDEYCRTLPGILKPPEMLVVLNGIVRSQPPSTPEQELRAHKDYGPRTLVNRVPDSGVLIARPEYSGFAVDKGGPYSLVTARALRDVADELAEAIGVTK